MLEILLGAKAAWFGVPALLGTAIFGIRLVLMLVAGLGHADLHIELGHDADLHTGDHGDPSHVFKLLSFQSISAFAMGFGWGGLAGYRGLGWDVPPSLGLAGAGGLGMVWVLALLLRGVHELQTSGNIHIEQTVGREGDVYLTVPPKGEGFGQVRLVVDGRQRIYQAQNAGERAVPSRGRVRVVGVGTNNAVVVVPT